MNGTQYQDYNLARGPGFATARGSMTADELAFISRHHERGMNGTAIARMLNRSIPDVEAVCERMDKPAPRPRPAGRPVPYASTIRLKLVPVVESMGAIALQIARDAGLKLEDLRGPSRLAMVVKPRQAAMYACYEARGDDGSRRWSLPQIGRYFGGRDHTTVLHGYRRHAERLAERARVG